MGWGGGLKGLGSGSALAKIGPCLETTLPADGVLNTNNQLAVLPDFIQYLYIADFGWHRDG